MKRLQLSPQLPLQSLLVVLILLLVVNLYADSPQDCKYRYVQNLACEAGCVTVPQSCVPYCDLVSTYCSLNKSSVQTPTTAQATDTVPPGQGQKLKSTESYQCAVVWDCSSTEMEMALCFGSGVNSSCVGAPEPFTCFKCSRGESSSACTAPINILQGCQLGG